METGKAGMKNPLMVQNTLVSVNMLSKECQKIIFACTALERSYIAVLRLEFAMKRTIPQNTPSWIALVAVWLTSTFGAVAPTSTKEVSKRPLRHTESVTNLPMPHEKLL
jgi:hypothetical protein